MNPPPSFAPARAATAITLAAMALLCSAPASAETIGSVDTVFKLIGPDHKIVVEAFDDPLVQGVACYISRAKTGGIKGGLGLAEDTSDASVACRQIDEIRIAKPLPRQAEVFEASASLLFKKVRVMRMVDSRRNALVYLVYADKLVEGSPKNSVTAVPVPRALPIPVK